MPTHPRRLYLPAITKARWVKRYKLGEYLAVLGTECESVGFISYTHVLYIFKKDESQPYIAVTSEYSDVSGQDGSRCLCLFSEGRHSNLGFSMDWVDLEKFESRALAVAGEYLQVSEAPIELHYPIDYN